MKALKLYRPDKQTSFSHIDSLFSDTINWDLIQTHLSDMLRVALSIKAGRITASTLLRKLGTYNTAGKTGYQAFRELGCAIRMKFLLKYNILTFGGFITSRRTWSGCTLNSITSLPSWPQNTWIQL